MTTQVDRDMAMELALTILNDGQTYHRVIRPTILNYARKRVNKTYDREMAIKGIVNNIVEPGLTRYRREWGPIGRVNRATKERAAREILSGMMDEIRDAEARMKALKAAGKPWTLRGR